MTRPTQMTIERLEVRLSRLIAQAESALQDIQEAISDGHYPHGLRLDLHPRLVLRTPCGETEVVTLRALFDLATLLRHLPVLDDGEPAQP